MRINEIENTDKDILDKIRPHFSFTPSSIYIKDGKVNCKSDIHLINIIDYIPVQFGEINGDFNCSHASLESLRGCPTIVKSDFSCSGNNIKSLLYGPIEVGKEYSAYDNNFETLKGIPKRCEYIGFSYSPTLEVLSLFNIENLLVVDLPFDDPGHLVSDIMNDILKMNRLNRQQKIFSAKRELIRNGYESNAKFVT